MGYQAPQQFYLNEERDSKSPGEIWNQQLDSDEEDTRKGTSKILFRAETKRERSYGDGHRLYVDRGTKRVDETRRLFHLQDDRTPVKRLSTEEEEAVHATSKRPTKNEGKGTFRSQIGRAHV